MAVRKNTLQTFQSGIHNRLDSEDIPKDAASDSIGWLTKDGRVELMFGRQVVGADGSAGRVQGEHTGFNVDGTERRFRKVWTGADGKIQYLNDSDVWTDTITGLSNSDVTFSNYASLAGNFVYIASPEDGIFKIVVANPGSYRDLTDSSVNFKGYSFIDKGRMIMWGVDNDPTGLYGSNIDPQDSGVYTTVPAEALTTIESDTLAFKAGGANRSCFGVQITHTASGEIFTDNYDGTLTGDMGGSGTINYMTGALTITGQTGAGTADYQWENSNSGGLTDFTKSATRVAAEGFVVRQDKGGDAIKVVIPHEGAYFSIKERSVYQFTPDVLDLNPTNELIRTDIGVSSLWGAVGTSPGIVFMDVGNPTEPALTILQRNITGDNFTTVELLPHFDFSLYDYSDIVLHTWDEFVLVACKEGTDENNRILMCNMKKNTVDVAPYGVRAFTKIGGYLHGGDPLSQTSYELFTDFDDVDLVIENEWISAGDTMGDEVLKRVKKMRFRGLIQPQQSVGVFISTEGGDWQKIGTIWGGGDYVDYSSSFAIGTTYIGQDVIGGGEDPAYSFLMEIKTKTGKFRQRRVRFVAEGYGYVAFEQVQDFDIWTYQEKIPKANRLKQNVSLDGTSTDVADPEF